MADFVDDDEIEGPSGASPALSPGAVVDLDGVALRLERFETRALAARHVARYYFVIPPGAVIAASGAGQPPRDARDQLHLVLAMTGGAIGKAGAEICVRTPVVAAPRFEMLARSLIEGFLVAFDRDALDDAASAHRKVRNGTE